MRYAMRLADEKRLFRSVNGRRPTPPRLPRWIELILQQDEHQPRFGSLTVTRCTIGLVVFPEA